MVDRKVYLEFPGRPHNVYDSLLSHPPNGYRFFSAGGGAWDNVLRNFYSSRRVYNGIYEVMDHIFPLHLMKGILEASKHTTGFDLTLATGHVIFREEPWLVDLEFASQLAGYNYYHLRTYAKVIQKRLGSRSNKAILPWTNMSKETLLRTLDCRRFRDKICVLRHAVECQTMHKGSKDGIKLLFVGSANYNYLKDFAAKGGKEVFALYDMLRKRYDHVHLTIRSRVPSEFHKKYASDKGVTIIDNVLSWTELNCLFRESDIFVFPTHGTPARAFLDAMSFGLPIITTDVWANAEYVTDGVTGIVVSKSTKIPYLKHNLFPNTFSPGFMRALARLDDRLLADLYSAACHLIEDTHLRSAMSRNSYNEIESGRFSLQTRNEKLRQVFENALAR